MSLTLPDHAETHIWQLRIPNFHSERDRWFTWLSEDERTRARRFLRIEDHDRYVLSRGGLRYLLGRYLTRTPETLAFAYSRYGKPSLKMPAADLHFNLAHSGEWVVYAVGQQFLLGIDVEQIVARGYLDSLIERCLTPAEQVNLPQASPERLIGFLKHWTVKEAHLKAIGLGLGYPMTDLQIDWHPEPQLVRPAKADTVPVTEWTLKLWYPADDAIAAACVGQAESRFVIRDFPVDGLR